MTDPHIQVQYRDLLRFINNGDPLKVFFLAKMVNLGEGESIEFRRVILEIFNAALHRLSRFPSMATYWSIVKFLHIETEVEL